MILLLVLFAAKQPQFTPVKATPFATAPVTLHVSSPEVDASKIKPYRAEWKETFATPMNQVMVIGTWTDRVERIRWKGREALKRTVTVDRPQRNIHAVTTLVVDARTFAPLMTEENDRHFEYSASRARKAFDTLAGMTDLFPATLPLRDGYAAQFPNFSASVSKESDPAAISWVTLRVKRRDAVALPNGHSVNAWLVDSDTPLGFYKVWIAEEPPYVVRTIWMGPGGGRSTFELVSFQAGDS